MKFFFFCLYLSSFSITILINFDTCIIIVFAVIRFSVYYTILNKLLEVSYLIHLTFSYQTLA